VIDSVTFKDAPFPIQWDKDKKKARMVLPRLEQKLPELLNYLNSKNIKLKNLEWRRQTLDDLFTSLTGRHLNE
jgi:ABC-2 type transport system ATP-binding protein